MSNSSQVIACRFPNELAERVRSWASVRGVAVSDVVRDAVSAKVSDFDGGRVPPVVDSVPFEPVRTEVASVDRGEDPRLAALRLNAEEEARRAEEGSRCRRGGGRVDPVRMIVEDTY